MANILIACEFSGEVRDAFTRAGHYAMSADLEPSERSGPHFQGDVRLILGWGWDALIAFPPCTDLAVSGARHFPAKRADGRQQAAIDFFMTLADAPIEKKSCENPVSIMASVWRKPDQIIQPWMFGHGEVKRTCLWLSGLPLLTPTKIVEGREPRVHWESPGPDRWKRRSRTYPGIAQAMADQWGPLL